MADEDIRDIKRQLEALERKLGEFSDSQKGWIKDEIKKQLDERKSWISDEIALQLRKIKRD